MSANNARASQPQSSQPTWPGMLFVVATAASGCFPLDRVLIGMVAAGQGIEAITTFLGLSRDLLQECLVRLGLRTPHDRPLRKPGPRGWSAIDTMCLITWRVAGIHPETIGLRLRRSPGSVRAKARRLGIPAAERRSLRRLDPASLIAPASDYANSAQASGGHEAAHPAVTASGACGTAAGPVQSRREAEHDGVGLRMASAEGSAFASPRHPVKAADSSKPNGQQEPRLSRDIAGGNRTNVPYKNGDAPSPAAPAREPAEETSLGLTGLQPEARNKALQRDAGAQTGATPAKASTRGWRRDRAAVMRAALRYFGCQFYKAAAAELGLTNSALQSFYSHVGLPRDRDRKKFRNTYDEEVAKANFERSGYELQVCPERRVYFFRQKKERATVRYCREVRKAMGLIGEHERYQSAPVDLDSSFAIV